jgi:SAM-dependent methyltransferase
MDAAARSLSSSASVFAPPRLVTRLEDCEFYHTMDVPGYGLVHGAWDLRGHVDSYLGGIDLRGKRVLELGTASGFLCVEMEKRGAEVVAYDLSEDYDGDLVPFAREESPAQTAARRGFVRRLNNGWWLVHRAHKLFARAVYGTVYDVPFGIGEVDVATFGCILLHLRDPYRALASATRLVRDAVVVTEHDHMWDRYPGPVEVGPLTEPIGGQRGRLLRLAHRLLGDGGWWKREQQLRERVRAAETSLRGILDGPAVLFLPDARDPDQNQAWWCFRSQAIAAMLGSLGFTRTTTSVTEGVSHNGVRTRVFTVIGRRD